MDKKSFLKETFFLFRNLNGEEIEEILKHHKYDEKCYSAGEIIQDCNLHDGIGIIIKGRATIKSGLDGVIINRLNKGDVYGAAALFDKPTHSTIVVASSECTVISMSREFIVGCISHSCQVSLNYIEFLSKKISFLNKKINACTAKSAENKLYNYLLQLPRQDNTLELTVDMSTIAKMLGIGRATLYRAFEKLESSGIITKFDKTITFTEVHQ